MKLSNPRRILAVFLILISGCVRDIGFKEARKLESQGEYIKAADKYEKFARANPANPMAPEALFRSALIYARNFGLCGKSKPLLETLVRIYPAFKERNKAERMIFVCPDYFPINPTSAWTYGDSQTLGKNMKQVIRVKKYTPAKVVAEARFYAGKKFVQKNLKTYYIGTDYLLEKTGKTTLPILKYPLKTGKKWSGGRGLSKTFFTVEKTGIRVKVAAGEFSGCVKIKQRMKGMTSWLYIYYAPWTGKILTSVAGAGFENRIEELLAYD